MTANLTIKSDKYCVIINYQLDGKRKQKWICTNLPVSGCNKRKAEAKRLELLHEWEQRCITDESDVLFSDWIKVWLERIRYSLSDNTYFSYRQTIHNVICPYFASKGFRLYELEDYHIADFYAYRMKNDGVSASTIRHYHANIRKALSYAVNHKIIKSNPAKYVELPRLLPHKANYYESDTLKRLLSYIKGDDMEVVIYLAAWFGLRRGEIAGLRWCDVDFNKRVISITGTMQDKGESGSKLKNLRYVPRTKSSASLRELAMPNSAVEFLLRLKREQDERKKKISYNHLWDDFICVRPNGDIIPLEYMSRRVPVLTELAGLPRLRLHELRHTNISLLLERGANIKELQVWAGHSTEKMTADVYSHVSRKAMVKLADMLDDI